MRFAEARCRRIRICPATHHGSQMTAEELTTAFIKKMRQSRLSWTNEIVRAAGDERRQGRAEGCTKPRVVASEIGKIIRS